MAVLKNTFVNGDLFVSGNLHVSGSMVQTDIANLQIQDKLIELASGSTTRTLLHGAGIQFGDEDLNVFISYSCDEPDIADQDTGSTNSRERFVVGVPIKGYIDSASHAGEIQWNGITNSPLFPTISFSSGVFTQSNYIPTSSKYVGGTVAPNIQIRVPTEALHVNAIDTGSFQVFTASIIQSVENVAENASNSLHQVSSSVNNSFLQVSQSQVLYSQSVQQTFNSQSQRISQVSQSFVNTLSTVSTVLSGSLNSQGNYLETASFNVWTGSTNSRLYGTASYAITASTANNVLWTGVQNIPTTWSYASQSAVAEDGPFLHISGGVVDGDTTLDQNLYVGQNLYLKGENNGNVRLYVDVSGSLIIEIID